MTNAVRCDGISKKYQLPSINIKEKILNLHNKNTNKNNNKFNRLWAIRDINFDLKQGESLGIIGHNGTGKTTLLSLILGTIEADEGKITTKGKIASLLDLGAGFSPDLTGKENVYLYSSILGLRLFEIDKMFSKIIEFSELGSAINNKLRTYSQGMIARLGFSTIIHSSPDILLIDEVLAVGDIKFQEKCIIFLNKFKRKNGSLILVTHDLVNLEKLCEQTLVLDNGKNYFYGKTKEAIIKHKKIMHIKKTK